MFDFYQIKAADWSFEKTVDLARISEWAQLPAPSFFFSAAAAAALPSKPLPQRRLCRSRLVTMVTQKARKPRCHIQNNNNDMSPFLIKTTKLQRRVPHAKSL